MSSSITGPFADLEWNPIDPKLGDDVFFNFSTDETTNPWIRIQAFQDKKLVLEQYRGAPDDPRGPIPLGPTGWWQSGPADCRADLIDVNKLTSHGHQGILASVEFTASG